MKYKVAMIGFWFGKLPNYFSVWLNGAKENPEWTFLLYTDDVAGYDYPKNVIVHYTTLSECVERAQKCYDFKICVPYAYKFCDFRPAFGEIFSEDLVGYDFWGTIDLDIVFGRIDHFITEEVLDKYDKILTRDHFCIYRNDSDVCKHYRGHQAGGAEFYKTVFSSPEIFAFGEKGKMGVYHIWLDNGWKMLDENWCADINVWWNHFEINSEHKNNSKQVFYHDKNGLFRLAEEKHLLKKSEFMYMHLQKRKMETPENIKQTFWVVPNRFIQQDGELENKDEILKVIHQYSGWQVRRKDFTRLCKIGTGRVVGALSKRLKRLKK